MTSYKSVETMYSTLRCGMRLYKLTTSDFAQCGDEIKQSIQNIGEFVFGLGLRNFLTCNDNFLSKRQAIQEIVLPYSERRFFLTKIAVFCIRTSGIGRFRSERYRTEDSGQRFSLRS